MAEIDLIIIESNKRIKYFLNCFSSTSIKYINEKIFFDLEKENKTLEKLKMNSLFEYFK